MPIDADKFLKRIEKLEKLEFEMLELLKKQQNLTTREIADELEIDIQKALNVLQKLEKEEIVHRHKRGTMYSWTTLAKKSYIPADEENTIEQTEKGGE